MEAEINGTNARLILKHVRLGHPKIFKPESYKGNGQPRYSAEFPVETGSEQDQQIKSAIKEIATAQYGEKAMQKIKLLMSDKGTTCYRPSLRDDQEGHFLLRANRREADGPPSVVDRAKKPITEASGKLYAGCYVNVCVDLWMQSGDYEGIRCTLVGLQFDADGPAYGAAPASADVFETLADDGDARDIFDDDIPF